MRKMSPRLWSLVGLCAATAMACGTPAQNDAGDASSDVAADRVAVDGATDGNDVARDVIGTDSTTDGSPIDVVPSDGESDVTAADGGDDVVAVDAMADAPVDVFTCTANAFLSCSGDNAVTCNATGDGTTMTACGGFGCNATAMRCNACAPSTTVCNGDALVVCAADGTITSNTACALGCNMAASPAPACARLTPSIIAANTCDTPGTSDLMVAAGMTFAINTDGTCDAVVPQPNGPALCVRKFANVTVAATGTVAITGSRGLSLVATGTMNIAGLIDASASSSTNGAGAAAAAGAGANGSGTGAGGGGAGHGTAGAAGGAISTAGGAAGAAYGTTVTPLLGGARGGTGVGAGLSSAAEGGGGGGALQIVSCGALTNAFEPATDAFPAAAVHMAARALASAIPAAAAAADRAEAS